MKNPAFFRNFYRNIQSGFGTEENTCWKCCKAFRWQRKGLFKSIQCTVSLKFKWHTDACESWKCLPCELLTVVIFGADCGKFQTKPEEAWKIRTICVTGKISEYLGKAQIVVTRPEQVFIFYKMEKGDLFWFDLNHEMRQGMAMVNAKKLME